MKEINFTSFKNLITERLSLRQLNVTDDLAISLLRSNKSVNKYIIRPKQTSIDEANTFITKINNGIKQNKWIYWAICLKDTTDLIGTICLWNFSENKTIAELGYELNPTSQGQGFMNEALRCITKLSFEKIKLKTIFAYTHRNNKNSTKLLIKNNFKMDLLRKDKENSNNTIFTLTLTQQH